MKFHWLWCQNNQGHFRHLWAPGTKNNGDYVTKHHAEIHYRDIRPEFSTPKYQPELLRKCAERKISAARV